MKIVIRKYAASEYVGRMTLRDGRLHPQYNSEWYTILCKIEGKTLDVDTNCVFKYNFNTMPIDGVSSLGLQVGIESIERIIDDVRGELMHCTYCGRTQKKATHCECCGRDNFLEFFDKVVAEQSTDICIFCFKEHRKDEMREKDTVHGHGYVCDECYPKYYELKEAT